MKHLAYINTRPPGSESKYFLLENHNKTMEAVAQNSAIHHLHTGRLKLTGPGGAQGVPGDLSATLLCCVLGGHLLSSTEAYCLDEMKYGILAFARGFWFVRFSPNLSSLKAVNCSFSLLYPQCLENAQYALPID